MKNKIYELHLPYFKQGDDLGHFVEKCDSHSEALMSHSEMLNYTADILKRLADFAAAGKISIIQADTHYISLSCEEELGKVLFEEGILNVPFVSEEEY